MHVIVHLLDRGVNAYPSSRGLHAPCCSGNLRDVSKRYEELRSRALKEALGLLLPELERELRANLLQEARDYLLTRATREAFKLASVAPRVVGAGYCADDVSPAERAPNWPEQCRGLLSSCIHATSHSFSNR